MDFVKNIFSIKDLENISGIKAHTIRIWEKRYNILDPMRTDSNIRFYSVKNLQKLLNITLLHQHGYKISTISEYNDDELPKKVNEIITEKSIKHHAIATFKLAMINFDQELFHETYNKLIKTKSFNEIFSEVFIPLLVEIGYLWQTDTITPAHEHFISFLLRQKMIYNVELLKENTKNRQKTFILFLPYNEIHDIGLIFIHYNLLLNGFKSIYIGESIPIESLVDMKKQFENITYICYLTIEPSQNNIDEFMTKNKDLLSNDNQTKLWLAGRVTEKIDNKHFDTNMRKFKSYQEVIELIEIL